MRLDTAYY